jgi:hypothetical protein
MKTVKVNKKSWHYQLADMGANPYSVKTQANDFCSYIRLVFKGIFFYFLIIVFGSLFAYIMLVEPMMWAISGFDRLFLEGNDAIKFGTGCWAIVVFCVTMFFISEWSDKRKRIRAENPSEPSFVAVAYDSIKNKICFKVDYE